MEEPLGEPEEDSSSEEELDKLSSQKLLENELQSSQEMDVK